MATLKSNYLAIILAVTASCSMSAFSSCVSSFSLGKNISNRCIYRNSQQVVEYMRQKGIEICNLRLMHIEERNYRVYWYGEDRKSPNRYALGLGGDFMKLTPDCGYTVFSAGDSFHRGMKEYSVTTQDSIMVIKRVKNHD